MKKLLLLSLFLSAAVTAWAEKTAKAVYVESDAGATLTFYYDDVTHEGEVRNLDDLVRYGEFSWYGWQKCDRGIISSVVIDPSFADYRLTTSASMFSGFEACQSITGLQYFNTEDVTDMTSMFSECSSLTFLDLSSFDTHNVKTMHYMFANCSELSQIVASHLFVTPAGSFSTRWSSRYDREITEYDSHAEYMFESCNSLVGGQGSTYDWERCYYNQDKTYARIDGGPLAQGYFTAAAGSEQPCYALAIKEGNNLTFCYKPLADLPNLNNDEVKTYDVSFYYEPWEGMPVWSWQNDYEGGEEWGDDEGGEEWAPIRRATSRSITSVIIDPSFAYYKMPAAMGLFGYMEGCQSITGLEFLDISEVDNMDFMFYFCTSLTTLDLSHFDTRNVCSMYGMFNECESLTTIYASDMFVAPETDQMFMGCNALEGGQGTRYDEIWGDDSSYAHIDGGKIDPGYFTASAGSGDVEDTWAILNGTTLFFYYKTRAEIEDLAGGNPMYKVQRREWNAIDFDYDEETGDEIIIDNRPLITRVVIDESYAGYQPISTNNYFENLDKCTSIEGLENLNVTNVKNMSYMFYGCSSLIALDLSSFYTPKLERVDYMFGGCSSLTAIYASEKFIAPDDYTTYNDSYTDVLGAYMFSGCVNIVGGSGTTYCSTIYNPGIWFDERLGRDRYEKGFDCSYACIDEGPSNPGYFTATCENSCEMEVTMPQGAYFDNQYLEIINATTDKKQRYLLKNSTLTYTFYAIEPNSTYHIFVKTPTGEILASIMDVAVGEDDVKVNIPFLKPIYDIALTITTPEGKDVTDQTSITWTSTSGAYVGQGRVLHGIIENKLLRYSIELPRELGIAYERPTLDSIIVSATNHDIDVELIEFCHTTCAGKVIFQNTKTPVYGANVVISQMLNDRYLHTVTASTDTAGYFQTQIIVGQPTTATVDRSGYKSIQLTEDQLFSESPLVCELSSINGPIINTRLFLTETALPGVQPQTSEYYDYNNVLYSLYNVTSDSNITKRAISNNSIQLYDQVHDGDVIRVTVESRVGAFAAMSQTCTINDKFANVSFDLTGLGEIIADYHTTNCGSVVGLLFDNKGNRVRREKYRDATVSISKLPQGNYNLVTMDGNTKYSYLTSLSQFDEFGLTEGFDYLSSSILVLDGQISLMQYDEVPQISESSTLILEDYSSLYFNKTEIAAGNYFTIYGDVKIQDEYSSLVSDVKLVFELPASINFVDNSVLNSYNNKQVNTYSKNENQIIIPLENYKGLEQYKFSVVPLEGGIQSIYAFIHYTMDGIAQTQIIDSKDITVKKLAIDVPSITYQNKLLVSGDAPVGSSIWVYDSEKVIGIAESQGAGTWSADCQLASYPSTYHEVYAEILTPDSLTLRTEMKRTFFESRKEVYPTQCIMHAYYQYEPKTFTGTVTTNKVTKGHAGPQPQYEQRIHWDFTTATHDVNSWTVTNQSKKFKFNFNIYFNDIELEKLKNVRLYTKSDVVKVYSANYDSQSKSFVAYDKDEVDELSFPVNLAVTYDYDQTQIVDDSLSLIDQDQCLKMVSSNFKSLLSETNYSMTTVLDEDDYIQAYVNGGGASDSVVFDIAPLDYAAVAEEMAEEEFYPYKVDSVYYFIKAEEDMNGFGFLVVDPEDEGAFRMHFSDYSLPSAPTSCRSKAPIKLADIKQAINKTRYDVNRWLKKNEKFLLIDQSEEDVTLSDFWNKLGVEKEKITNDRLNGTLVHAGQMLDAFERNMDVLEKHRNKIIKSIVTKCKDGSYKFSETERQQKFDRLSQISASETDYMNTFFENIDRYKTSLLWSTIFDCSLSAATLGMGSHIKAITKIKWKPIAKLFSKFNEKSEAFQENTINAALYGVGLIDNPFKAPGHDFRDYESRREELLNHMQSTFDALCRDYTNLYNQNKLTSNCDEDIDDDEDSDVEYIFKDIKKLIDPSGYVYEAVPSNRVEGVTATVYYREAVVDTNGDSIMVATKWDAEQYGQQNPLFTDAEGRYQWDVPQGEWQVKYEKEGYETTYSEWLPVPPPQLDVNIPVTQYSTPEIAAVEAYESGIIITFDKYMMPETLTSDFITLLQNGSTINGTITLLDEEAVPGSATRYAKQLRINYAKALDYGSKIVLNVNSKVMSYAGVPMANEFSQEFVVDREVTSLETTAALTMVSGEQQEVEITAMPPKAAKDKTVTVEMSNWEYVSVDNEAKTFDSNGIARFTFTAEQFGQVLVTYHLENTDQTVETIITVLPDMSTGIKDIVNNDWSSDKGYLLVLDINGKMINCIDSAESISDFDMTTLNDGIYILTFVGENHTTSKKVMKKSH